jgi:lysophospholipase L1-like esterase
MSRSETSYRRIAALGSSFAAGPGIPPVVDKGAMRSGSNYPHVLAELLGADLVDLTVSGATTATILDSPQRTLRKKFPPQIEGVPADVELVTITAAGNDLNYIGSMLATALAARMRGRTLTKPLARLVPKAAPPALTHDDYDRATNSLLRVVDAVRARAQNARVVLVDYFTVLGEDARYDSRAAPFTDEQIAAFRGVGDGLTQAFAAAASRTGADLVLVSALSADHGIGASDPWMHGALDARRFASWFHPNAAGMRAVAEEIRRVVT